ncbi:outer membrane protein assembly factor BamE [Parvularcula lutaonensis]|uniref:Outer membrane protein assembly factor BamE n=1 Tax=Parvularcula lutaonensis TaxID=491923 RepID=A0ABV7MBU4_9PROT|nr:outer membrane protein assembly factor BamE [Parvularcula lutaonensis]GGY49066.1 SmpA/OmlA family lipoprotein [Parvularcula lutaonensis]
MKRVIVPALIAAMVLSGCVSTRSQHGYIVELGESGLDAIPGIDSKESVLARFGEPSVRPPLNDDTWYYISHKTNARAFFRTQVYERNIVAFKFDEDGMVSEVESFNLADGTDIDIVDRVTATRGKELNFFEQLLGGVGQVGVPGQQGGPGTPGQGPQ